MGIRKDKVAKMVETMKAHDNLASSSGWRATPDTDQARKAYEKARKDATPEERKLFDRIYN